MVTFADLMALMMTFFVLLYSFSNTDEGKYKEVVESMADGFGASRIELPNQNPGEVRPESGMIKAPVSRDTPKDDSSSLFKYKAELERIYSSLAEDIEAGVLAVESRGGEIIIRFPEKATFPTGSDTLNPNILPVLDRISHLIEDTGGMVRVEGHTDNIPIHGGRFRSNWELSTARAVSVMHGLLLHIHPLREEHIEVVGLGAKHPLAPNDSEENRAKNRRVEISIAYPENDNPTGPEQP